MAEPMGTGYGRINRRQRGNWLDHGHDLYTWISLDSKFVLGTSINTKLLTSILETF